MSSAALTDLLARRRISLRLLTDTIAPGLNEDDLVRRLTEAVVRTRRARAFDGLSDDLNPELLDPVRILAFLHGLTRLDDAVLASLEGRTLYLGAPDLGLQVTSPYTPDDLAADGYALTVPPVPPGALVMPALRASLNLPDVLARADDARKAVGEFDWQVNEWERALREIDSDRDPDSYISLSNKLADAKFRRYCAAIVWRQLLAAAAAHDPTHTAANRAAEAAVGAYAVPPRYDSE
ncbi:MAG TPA: hypothetical protein VEA69_06950 [Tepidisphaeraceae bacterium]|nr:hypothetical protein [Tepidisphaeraceae bacterium]